MFLSLLRRTPPKATIQALYGVIVAQARLPSFYLRYGVPDTVDGRFDLIVLHLFLLGERMAGESGKAQALMPALFDRFCVDLDHNLREMGVGDLTVPRRMKSYAEAFYGRREAYRKALAANDRAALSSALARNVFGREESGDESSRLADYVFNVSAALAVQPSDAVMQGRVRFPDPENPAAVPSE